MNDQNTYQNRGQVYGNVSEPQHHNNQKQEKKRRGGLAGIITAVALAGVMAGSAITGFVVLPLVTGQNLVTANQSVNNEQPADMPNIEEAPAIPSSDPNAEAPQDGNGTQQGSDNPVVDVAENVSESVVGVVMYNKQLISGQEPVEEMVSSGTGFVLSEDGYIITNNHVVAEGNVVKIVTNGDEEHVARIVGKDSKSDLAVLKVDGLNLKPVTIGDSTTVKAGELVVAIGNPLGQSLSNTVTVGYISAVSREVMVSGSSEPMEMLQTDAAINPGNSGGPLINSQGEVIGITTLKSIIAGVDANGYAIPSEGIGFAIPITNAMGIVEQLIEEGGVPNIGIGINYAMMTAEDAELWEMPRGALIGSVVPGGPAERAGLQAYDIIIEFDGVDLTTGEQNIPVLSDREAGETVTAKVWRDGQEFDIELTLADLNKIGLE